MNRRQVLDYLSTIRGDLDKIYNIKTVGLIESFARDEASHNSDIEIICILKKDTRFCYLFAFSGVNIS